MEQAGDAWVHGRVTAGYSGAPVKFNQQIDERSEVARECQQLILSVLERNPLFISAALPNIVYPPMFNRYSEGMTFGAHVDGSVRIHPYDGRMLRTDISATLFLSELDSYDGGELQVQDTDGAHSVRLEAGDMVVYPATRRSRRSRAAGGSGSRAWSVTMPGVRCCSIWTMRSRP